MIYDNVQISDDAKNVLKMHPKFMLYEPVDEKAIETEIEKGVMKARYAWMNKNDDRRNVGNNGDVEIVRDVNEAVVFSLTKKKADYANVRATELPTVQRLYPPKPTTLQKETNLQTLKDNLMSKVRESILTLFTFNHQIGIIFFLFILTINF